MIEGILGAVAIVAMAGWGLSTKMFFEYIDKKDVDWQEERAELLDRIQAPREVVQSRITADDKGTVSYVGEGEPSEEETP